jgi:RecA-family ATPase
MANRANEADRPYKSIHKAPVLRHPNSKQLRDCGQGAVMANDDPDKLILRPITDLLKIERRKQLVPNLLHAKGVTTIVAPSGEGKTTTMFSMGLSVAIGLWGGELIEQRPMIWIAGEDQEGLRAIFEAWCLHNPDRHPNACFNPDAVDFSNNQKVDELIKVLERLEAKGLSRPLIMADALADILGDLNEDKSHDINQVYRNIWRVVNRFDAAFVVLHHSGWDEKRERGSTAIRAKSDILILIINFDPEEGVVELQTQKAARW